MQPTHFKGKDAVGHVAEAQAQGIISSAEIHGTEIPGHLSAGADAARETSLILSLLAILLIPFSHLLLFGFAWLIWKTGRSAWLGWSRIERLHRIVAQEQWEIEHHRGQEREELKVLYAAKGFEGKLLEDVLDVLMADGDRLLRVMVEEELGLSLEIYEHPLKQALGAFMGCLAALVICLGGFWLYPPYGLFVGAVLTMGTAAGVSAFYERNRLIPAIVWNIGLGIVAFTFVFLFLDL